MFLTQTGRCLECAAGEVVEVDKVAMFKIHLDTQTANRGIQAN